MLFFRPFTVLFFASGGFFWWGLVALALALWLTYDYLKRGDMFSQVDAMLSGEGRIFGTYVERRNERDRTGY